MRPGRWRCRRRRTRSTPIRPRCMSARARRSRGWRNGRRVAVAEPRPGLSPLLPRCGVRDLSLSDAFIDALLDADLTERIHLIDLALPWWTTCTEPQQRALVELVFNMGLHGLEHDAARFLIHLRAGRGHAASCELASLPWANRVGPTRAGRIIAQVQA